MVQIEPAPTPTLIASAPAVGERLDALLGDDVAGDDRQVGHDDLIRSIALMTPAEWPWAVSIATASTRIGDERLDALLEVGADADRGGAAQPARRRRGWRWGTPGASGCPSP